ncbi:PSP1 C-terminal conserved region-domain-containing protein [Irpex lacteus]|nr:PSP1 C-terminal conserved region-domain-containing protein [Irpex lacteus]
MQSPHAKQTSEDTDRTNRFLASHGSDTPTSLSLRERAASQPPRTSNSQAFLASPSLQTMRTTSGGPGVWPRISSGLNPNSPSLQPGLPSSVPTRSASFSNSPNIPPSLFSSAMRESRFASTFEDDESEALSDIHDPYDDRLFGGHSPSAIGSGVPTARGRSYAADMTRSRSQSLATTHRPGAIGSPFPSSLWNESAFSSSSNPLSIPDSRYNELKPPGSSRYGSLGALGRSPSNGYSHHGVGSFTDHSNMSPFVRDVGQILLDDGSAFRDLWVNPPPARDENGGGSGTTSRRHSVSVVQARRPTIVGFNAMGAESDEPTSSRPGAFHSAFRSSGGGGGSGLLLTDDDLASDLGMVNLNLQDDPRSSSLNPPSAGSSLPIYAPLSRSPPAPERLSPYQPLQLNIPGHGNSYAARQGVGSPSDSGFSAGSPSRHQFEGDTLYGARDRQNLMARFVPGKGIQHIPETSVLNTPLSAGGMRSGFGPSPIQRRPSDASKALNDLGKGVPLHSVPTSWPLFIVEFKAGRTDLFYCTDLSLDIRIGDLVIVEADRGKDLGKIINDTITLAEVEAFQKQQKLLSGYAEAQGQAPTSPSGSGKEISPKMIYGKASHHDTQGLNAKLMDEAKALELCRTKVKQRKLPMEVIDAEYQWDRRKLTFYFVAEKRIDFRELVRELFRYAYLLHSSSRLGNPIYEQTVQNSYLDGILGRCRQL